jgi:arabinose-5-phosphate isomerase
MITEDELKCMDFQKHAKEVIEIELNAIRALLDCIDESFDRACELLKNCQGRIIVLGIGKSGHIGSKIAATLASTGSPAFSVHAAEASHGDLGMITKHDVVLAISFSGNTPEVVALLPRIASLGVPLISMSGNPRSKLAQAATVSLLIDVKKEACPLNLAPTASTTATLVLGDALAIALLSTRNFTQQDFAFSHPGGNLGKQLMLTVENLMHSGDTVPLVDPNTSFDEVLKEMSAKRLGMTIVSDDSKRLLGIFTDGDIRRCYQKQGLNSATLIKDIMTASPKTVKPSDKAGTALDIMERAKITALVVVDDHNHVQGLLHMHDILQAVIEE